MDEVDRLARLPSIVEDFWAHNTALFVKDFHGNVRSSPRSFWTFCGLDDLVQARRVPTLDRNVFRTLPIVVPSPCEQRKIAAVLGLVQRAIEQQERLIALTTELKKALLHKLFNRENAVQSGSDPSAVALLMPAPGEHKTVQSRILAYAQEIGWTFVPRDEARAPARL